MSENIKFQLMFTYPRKWRFFSWIISKRLKTNYSHVAIAVYVKPTDQWRVYQASHGSVHCIGKERFFKKNKLVIGKDISLDRNDFFKMIGFLDNQLGVGYSEIGAIASTIPYLRRLRWGVSGDNSFICSELAARAFEVGMNVDFSLYRKHVDHIDPKTLEDFLNNNFT